MKDYPWVERIHILPAADNRTLKNIISIISTVRAEKYKLIFPSTRITLNYMDNILTRTSGAKYKVGNLRGNPLWDRFDCGCRLDSSIHRVEQNRQLFEAVMGNEADFEYKFYNPSTPDAEKNADKKLNGINFADKPMLGVHLGCDIKNKFKQWPLPRYYKLFEGFLSDFNEARILLFTGPGEEYTTKGLPDSERTAIIKEELDVVSALLSKCSLVLTNDSGMGHIARAVNVPVLSIMGPGSITETKPYGVDGHVIAVEPRLDCMPCLPGRPTCDGKYPCINNLSVETVRDKLYPLWEKYTG